MLARALVTSCSLWLLMGCYASQEGGVAEVELPVGPGLITDPGAEAVPPGAFRIADNVVMRRPGIVEPRPGFNDTAVTGLAGEVRRGIPYDADILLLASLPSGAKWMRDGGAVTDEDSSALDLMDGYWAHAEARNNLYIAASDGVRKVTGAGDTTAVLAGMPQPPTISIEAVPASGTALVANESVAYRAVFVREDENQVVVRSAPSARVVEENPHASDRDVTLRVYLTGDVVAGDVLELYRSINSSSTPNDELYLVSDQEISSTDVTNGYVEITDAVDDSDLGRALYTNPSRQSVGQANDRPYRARAMAAFKRAVFYGNVLGPQRITLKAELSLADLAGQADGIGFRRYTGDRTNGSDVIAVSSTTGLKVGQIFGDPSNFSGSGPVVVTAIGSGTVTLSESATSSASGVQMDFYDSIRIGSNYYPAYLAGRICQAVSAGYPDLRVDADDDVFAYGISDIPYSGGTPGSATPGKDAFVIEERKRGGSAFEVWATHGDEYFPPLPEPTEANGVESEADDYPNGLMWSKSDQPEHVPFRNFITIGSQSEPILQLVPARDYMVVWKRDGVWRLSGFGADSGWRVDPLDPTLRLLGPDATAYLNGAVWAWTNRGIGQLTDMGFVSLSDGVISRDPYQDDEDLVDLQVKFDDRTNPIGVGAWMVADELKGEILVSVGATGVYGQYIYVYSTRSKAWVRWDLQRSHGFIDPYENTLTMVRDSTVYEISSSGTPEAFTAILEWHSPAPSRVEKMWQEWILSFQVTDGVPAGNTLIDLKMSSSEASQSDLDQYSVPDGDEHDARVWVPADHARANRLCPRAEVSVAFGNGEAMEITGSTLTYQPYSRRSKPL